MRRNSMLSRIILSFRFVLGTDELCEFVLIKGIA